MHLNFTDRLFGPTPADAAQRVVAVVQHFETMGVRVTASLHDVPQPADGGNYLQRVHAYRAVCAALHGRATNSDHERRLLSESDIAAPTDVVVIPLPLEADHALPRRRIAGPCNVGVLGFVYPGKGHAEVLAAMTGLPSTVEFLAIGECSEGHDDLQQRLRESAERAGRTFAMTGYLPTAELSEVVHQVAVPVAHHRHVSASGSINTWIAAHRRPLVPKNRYTVEHSQRHPGTLQMYPDTRHGLTEAIEYALHESDSTWLAPGTVSGSSSAGTAALYARALSQWHG